jgi:hypothetical protein
MSYIGKTPTSVPLTSSDITDSIISLPKLTDGTDGNLISYDASGNPVAVATGTDGQVLTSTGAGSPPVFETLPAGGVNTPAFLASSTGEVAVANVTDTIINNYSVEILDTDSCFASSRFTPTTAGYYYIFGTVGSYPNWTAVNFNVNLKKNGTTFAYTSNYTQGYPQYQAVGIVYLNGSSDYVEVYCYQDSGSSRQIDGGVHRIFGGFKIIE